MKQPNVCADEVRAASPTPVQVVPCLVASVRLVAGWIALLAAVWMAQPAYAQDSAHVVSGGENLSTIARQYGMTMQELAAYNGIVNPNLVYVGQQIQIPSDGQSAQALAPATTAALPGEAGYHTVARGETLSGIAKTYGITSGDLMRLNGISNANLIWVGQKLRISARANPVDVAPDHVAKPALADDIYIVQASDTLAEIAAAHQTTVQALLVANGLPNPNFVWVGQRLRVKSNTQATTTLSPVAAPADGRRWIEVDLTSQTLTAWQGDVAVMFTYISGGRASTPTVTGRFTVGAKYPAQRMIGPGYDLPNVPWVMYFHGSYAIHGAYWHSNFGTPMSHGCVNLRPVDAGWLFEFARVGTVVNVHQ